MSSIKHPSEAAKGFSACVRAAEHDCSIDRPTDCFRAVELSRLTYAILAPELKIRKKKNGSWVLCRTPQFETPSLPPRYKEAKEARLKHVTKYPITGSGLLLD